MKARVYKSVIIENALESITPKEQEKVDRNMLIAAKIIVVMDAKGWSSKDLMEATGQKNLSVISDWLSGTYSFSHDTLLNIEKVLETQIRNA